MRAAQQLWPRVASLIAPLELCVCAWLHGCLFSRWIQKSSCFSAWLDVNLFLNWQSHIIGSEINFIVSFSFKTCLSAEKNNTNLRIKTFSAEVTAVPWKPNTFNLHLSSISQQVNTLPLVFAQRHFVQTWKSFIGGNRLIHFSYQPSNWQKTLILYTFHTHKCQKPTWLMVDRAWGGEWVLWRRSRMTAGQSQQQTAMLITCPLIQEEVRQGREPPLRLPWLSFKQSSFVLRSVWL